MHCALEQREDNERQESKGARAALPPQSCHTTPHISNTTMNAVRAEVPSKRQSGLRLPLACQEQDPWVWYGALAERTNAAGFSRVNAGPRGEDLPSETELGGL